MIHIYRSTSCLAYDRPALQRAPLEEGFHDGQVANSPPTPKKKQKPPCWPSLLNYKLASSIFRASHRESQLGPPVPSRPGRVGPAVLDVYGRKRIVLTSYQPNIRSGDNVRQMTDSRQGLSSS